MKTEPLPAFFDTNTLIYAVSADAAKAQRVLDLTQHGGWISVQVLNEMARVLRGKLRYDWSAVHASLDQIQAMLGVVPVELETHRIGLEIAARFKIGVFDAMIAASALKTGCDRLYSEDMHHGLVIGRGLTITNPFRE